MECSYQSGFRKKDSSVYQLTYFYDFLAKALDSGKEVKAIFCDIKKAFDRVWHEGLLIKLHSVGIRGNLLKLLKSYLTNRQQFVNISGTSSTM